MPARRGRRSQGAVSAESRAGEQDGAGRRRVVDRGAEQRVLGGGQAGGGRVARRGAGVQPVALALEGVGGQRDAVPAPPAKKAVPVDGGAGGVGCGEGDGELGGPLGRGAGWRWR